MFLEELSWFQVQVSIVIIHVDACQQGWLSTLIVSVPIGKVGVEAYGW